MSMPGEQGNRENMLLRAGNRYRQIQAENPSNVQRVTEAQRALDSLIVTRGALANAMRANVLSRPHSIRMGMMEHMMMGGRCPEKDQVELKCDDFSIEIVNSDRRSRGQMMGPTSLR